MKSHGGYVGSVLLGIFSLTAIRDVLGVVFLFLSIVGLVIQIRVSWYKYREMRKESTHTFTSDDLKKTG